MASLCSNFALAEPSSHLVVRRRQLTLACVYPRSPKCAASAHQLKNRKIAAQQTLQSNDYTNNVSTTLQHPPPTPSISSKDTNIISNTHAEVAYNNNSTSFFSAVASVICNSLDELVNSNSSADSVDTTYVSGSFTPLTHESPPTPCTRIRGTIPATLNGVFLRNGPNPVHIPKRGYHFFDGDGMIHAVKLQDGHASHACRFIRTNRYIHEAAAGQALFVKPLSELSGVQGIAKLGILMLRHLLGLIDIIQGFGPANAGLAFLNGKVLAMSEDDMPYWVNVSSNGDIETVQRYDFEGKLKSSMSAHPKVDPKTGELFSFSYNLLVPPYLKYFRVTAGGEKLKDIPITIKEPTLVHDFALTDSYAVFYEHQIVFRLHNMFKGGSPIVIDKKKAPRVGILPKYDTNEENMRWFDCDVSFGTCLHFLNAWEEGDEVVMVGSILTPTELIFTKPTHTKNQLMEFRFNLKTGKSTREQVSYVNIDIGRINENYIGKKSRYAYMCTSGPWPKSSGVCKVDLSAPRPPIPQPMPLAGHPAVNTNEPCIVGWHHFGERRYGSEAFFVPRSRYSSLQSNDDEDDGFLLTFVHDEVRDSSELLILDAKSPTLATVASITMPTRVPYGFHSLFLNETQLHQQ